MVADAGPLPGLPKYRQIAQVYRERIRTGVLAPGAPFPAEPDIAAEFGCHRGTVRQAVAMLRAEGLLDVVQGRGTFVRETNLMVYMPQRESRPTTSEVMDRFSQQITEEDRTPSQTITVSLVVPSNEIRERLKLSPADTVVARRRVRSINGQPVNTNDSHFPVDIVGKSEIMNPEDIARGTNQVLADLGYAQVRATDELVARMPTPTEAQRLGIGTGTPVIVHLVTGYDANDRPVRCTQNILPADRNKVVFEREWK